MAAAGPAAPADRLARRASPRCSPTTCWPARSPRGGRLDRLLAAAVGGHRPGAAHPGGRPGDHRGAGPDDRPVGYRVVTSAKPDRARHAGRRPRPAWLARLRAIAPKHLLVATPYADPDLVALERGGNAEAGPVPDSRDLDATARVLGVQPSTKVSWPPDGAAHRHRAGRRGRPGRDRGGARPDARCPAARTRSPAAPRAACPRCRRCRGQAVALVSDPVVQRLLDRGRGQARRPAGGPRLAEQRLLAELAMITAEAPNDSRTIVLAPPGGGTPRPAYAGRSPPTSAGSPG